MTDLFRTEIAVPGSSGFTAARRDLEPNLADLRWEDGTRFVVRVPLGDAVVTRDVLVAVDAYAAGFLAGLYEGRRRAQADMREALGL